MRNDNSVVVMNFSHVYEEEIHLKKKDYQWIDCTYIKGTECYLDDIAKRELEKKIEDFSPEGIHFIDSGNYHYVTKLWTDKIKEPFSLVVFDHHTDMQPSMFENLMSCGCWVKEVLDHNEFLKKVILVGAKEEMIQSIEEKYKKRLIYFSEQSLRRKESWEEFSKLHLMEPVYISVDKDILSEETVRTNWDQGSLKLSELEALLVTIMNNEEVIGIDICGEANMDEPYLVQRQVNQKNDFVNMELLELIRSQKEREDRDEKVSNY